MMTLFTILVVYSKKRKLRVYEIYPSTHKGTPSNKGIKLSVVLYKKRPAAAACAVVPYSYEYPNEEMRKGTKRPRRPAQGDRREKESGSDREPEKSKRCRS